MRVLMPVVLAPVSVAAAAVVVVVALSYARPSLAASGACTSDAQCTAPQVCRLSESICVASVTDLASLQAAITAANVDAARDVIVVGSANPDDTEGETHIEFADVDAASFVVDPEFGPLAFPVITTPITIEGNNVALDTLDASTEARMFLVRPDVAGLDAQPDLTLKKLRVVDARPGPAGAGAVFFGGGAVHVTDVATTGGLLGTFNADSVIFSSNGDDNDAAPADAVVVLEGGPAVLVNCSFQQNVGTIAGALLSSATSLTVTGGDFTQNGGAGAGAASVSTDASFTNVTFAENEAPVVGAVQATGGLLRITGGTMRDNNGTADGAGVGAVVTSTNTSIAGTTQFTGNRGAAVAGVDATGATATLSLSNATFSDNHAPLAGGVRSVAVSASLSGCTFTNNSADDGAAGFGGAVQARTANIQNGTFRGNFAAAGGGAIALTNTPASTTRSQVVSSVVSTNTTDGSGGAVLDNGAALTIDDTTLNLNEADAGGGGVAVASLAAGNTVEIKGSTMSQNRARPSVSLTTGDPGLDELGDDIGHIEFRVTGVGSAILAGAGVAAASVNVHDNCIMGNAANALDATAGGGMTANDNWFGDATGPSPLGGGDTVNTVVIPIGTFHDDATGLLCERQPLSAYERVFLQVTVTGSGPGAADINTDYHVLDPDSGGTLLASTAGNVIPDLHIGKLDFDFAGVNDADNEGNELFTFAVPPCQDAGCEYFVTAGQSVQFSIIDNGDGVVGEGEGEGDDCEEKLTLKPSALELPNTGEASSASLKVTNDSACDVQLFAPLVKKGASQGFSVDPILQSDLVLTPGDAVNVIVKYTPPDTPPEDNAPPVGELQLETTRGSLVKIPLSLVNNCACSSSTSQRSPALGVVLVAALGVLVSMRRQRRRNNDDSGGR